MRLLFAAPLRSAEAAEPSGQTLALERSCFQRWGSVGAWYGFGTSVGQGLGTGIGQEFGTSAGGLVPVLAGGLVQTLARDLVPVLAGDLVQASARGLVRASARGLVQASAGGLVPVPAGSLAGAGGGTGCTREDEGLQARRGRRLCRSWPCFFNSFLPLLVFIAHIFPVAVSLGFHPF